MTKATFRKRLAKHGGLLAGVLLAETRTGSLWACADELGISRQSLSGMVNRTSGRSYAATRRTVEAAIGLPQYTLDDETLWRAGAGE